MYTRKIQQLYIGLWESKTFESRSKTLDMVIQFLYGGSITTVGVVKLSMYCQWFYILFLYSYKHFKELCFLVVVEMMLLT